MQKSSKSQTHIAFMPFVSTTGVGGSGSGSGSGRSQEANRAKAANATMHNTPQQSPLIFIV
jgi:hypothetical protein